MIKKCDICGSNTNEKYNIFFKDDIWFGRDYKQGISHCSNCGFIFVNNPLSDEELSIKYKKLSRYEYNKQTQAIIEDNKFYKQRCKEQKSFIFDAVDDVDSMLEIGSTNGYNLNLYKNIFKGGVYGIEPSQSNSQSAKQNYNIDTFCGMFDEYIKKYPNKHYDLVFMAHVLEHIVNPHTFMQQCSKINSKYFFIEVPTIDYKFIDEPLGLFIDEHVNHFTFESLQYLMNKNGYMAIKAEIPFYINIMNPQLPVIRTLWKKSDEIKQLKPIFSSEELLERYMKITQKKLGEISTKISQIDKNAKVALWAIGYTASRILGNTNLSKLNILRVYDSDPLKAGLEFAGKKISPFDPKDIENGIVDTIILTTRLYSIGILKALEPYKNKVRVINLFD